MSEPTPEFPLLELRRYAMQPGRRDELADWFDQAFIAELEALPIRVIGQFRDLANPDLWVWLRAFRNQPERQAALHAFYTSAFWLPRRQAVNATLISSDDVHLLRPTWPGSALSLTGKNWPPQRANPAHGALYVQIVPAPRALDVSVLQGAWPALWQQRPAIETACYQTEPSPNSYPRLPVHEGDPVIVVFALFADLLSLDAALAAGLSEQLLHLIGPAPRALVGPWQHRLLPTQASALRA